jgi:hypothetical protein
MLASADRIFERPDGSLHSLALTQIGTADAQIYVPDAPQPQQPQPEAEQA